MPDTATLVRATEAACPRLDTRSIYYRNIILIPPNTNPPLPTREDLLAFIGQQAGKVGTREIARAFGLKNADRASLKQMLRDLADDGTIEKRRKKLHHAGTLPGDRSRRHHRARQRR